MNPSPAGSVIGGGVEWQPPYVPERLRTGYNNKPLREVANKNNMDKSTSYHNLALREITPPHFTFFQRFFFCILLNFLCTLFIFCSCLCFALFHANKRTFPSRHPSEVTSPCREGGRFSFHLPPITPYLFFFPRLSPCQLKH